MTLPVETGTPQALWSRHRALLACAVIGATLLALIVQGHDGRRIAQLSTLAVPLLVWLLWPVQSDSVHRLRICTIWLWAMAFALDAALRAYLLDAYQSAPNGSLVLGAVANTNARESAEYLSMHWRSMVVWSAAVVAAGFIVGRFARWGVRASAAGTATPPWPRWAIALMCAVMLVASAGYASKPWRRLHPLAFWPDWAQSVLALKKEWADQARARGLALERAKAAAPAVVRGGPATIVLVVTDSINRDNLGLYGYGRATTPRLVDHKAQLGDDMLVLRHAWSADASTLPALRNMFNLGTPRGDDTLHVLALARAAGYKLWWISNHDDVAIEQEHARHAHVVDMVNRTPGRASASLDGEVLDCVQEALDDPASRKLIVVHLLGAHPHYRLRYPEGANPFDDEIDAVETGMVKAGRSARVRDFRQAYDAALLYHDSVVSELFQLTRGSGASGEYRAWMYLSDHGQEVGHSGDRAGHSPSTASGYRIPAVIWRNRQGMSTRPEMAEQPFRADWTSWTLADLLNVQWAGNDPRRNVLHADYQWRAPEIPVTIESFTK
jgi:heptose-I-phosphate ethanolaminephosphotransferase